METKKFNNTFELADYMYEEFKAGREVTFFTDYYGASKLLGDLLIYSEIKPYCLELESVEFSNYDDIYSVAILSEGELYICKCWCDAYDYEMPDGSIQHRKAGYLYDETDTALYDGEVTDELRESVDAKREYIVDVDYTDGEDDYDDEFWGDDEDDDPCAECDECDDCDTETPIEDALLSFGVACSVLGSAIVALLVDDEDD